MTADSLKLPECFSLTADRLDSLTKKEEVEKIYLFTEMELRTAAEKIKAGKAAGQDVIPPEVVNITAQAHTLAVLDDMNDLLAKGQFLKDWKTARLVLIEKKRGDGGEMKYRPLRMLNGYGKLLEPTSSTDDNGVG